MPRQGILLAAAMFVFVIDTSFMNVSISAVVHDLDTTVSGVQSAVAIEALVSAAFILISSKVGDLFGRKRAFVVGMVFYAVGALATQKLRRRNVAVAEKWTAPRDETSGSTSAWGPGRLLTSPVFTTHNRSHGQTSGSSR